MSSSNSVMAYRTIVVGVSGSAASLQAVEHAADLAHITGAQLVLVCAYTPLPPAESNYFADVLKDEAYLVRGSSPSDELLRVAAEKAAARGAKDIVRRAVEGNPLKILLRAAADTEADLMVVGHGSEDTMIRRHCASLGDALKRRSRIDVLVAYPTSPRKPEPMPKSAPVPVFSASRLGVQVG